MRIILWLLSAVFILLGVIFAFQNTSIIVPSYFFLKTMNATLFIPFLILFLCGFGGGFFLGLSMKAEKEDNEDEAF